MVKVEFIESGLQHLTPGTRSRIEMGEMNGQAAIRKTFLIPESVESDELARAIALYRKSLINARLNIPKNYYVQTTASRMEIVDQFIAGTNVNKMIQDNHPNTAPVWEKMIHQLCGANAGDHSLALIDVKPDNFLIDEEGVLYYVDLIPPMIFDSEGLISPWMPTIYKYDRQTATFLFGDTGGQVTRLLSLCELSYSQAVYDRLKEQALAIVVAGNLPPAIIEYIITQILDGFPDLYKIYGATRKSK